MRTVIFSRIASVKLEKILDYLENKWSEKTKLEFIKKLNKSIDLIKKFPESTEKSKLKKTFTGVL